jgi:hypothetical protein
MDEQIISTRSAARQAGAQWYFTGKACPRGHVTLRSVAGAHCRECARERWVARWAIISPPEHRRPKVCLSGLSAEERLSHKRKQWRESYRRCKGARPLEEIRAEQKVRREAKERDRAARKAEWQAASDAKRAESRERNRVLQKAWRAANPGYMQSWKRANPGRMRELNRRWERANPDKVREGRNASKRSRSKGNIKYLMAKQSGLCALCPERLGARFDVAP